jgi:dipeptidyl aminopeptidase/acylaminoacyl peptidase
MKIKQRLSSLLTTTLFFSMVVLAQADKNTRIEDKKTTGLGNTILPLEYFTKPSERNNVTISPDGKNIVAIIKTKGKEVFGIINLKEKKITSLINVRGSGGNIEEVRWANNERLVYTVYETSKGDKREGGTGELYAVNIDGTKHNIIFGYRANNALSNSRLRHRKSSYGTHEIVDFMPGDNKHIMIAYYPWKLVSNTYRFNDNAKPIIKRLNIYSGKMSNGEQLPVAAGRAIVDNDGVVRFAVGINSNNRTVISYRESADKEWNQFRLNDFEGTRYAPISFSKDNQNVYLLANVGGGTRALYLFNLKDKSIKKLFHDTQVDIDKLVYDFTGRRIVYVGTELSLPKYHYLEPNNTKSNLHKRLMETFTGNDVIITSSTANGEKLVVYVYADDNPGDFYLLDTKTFKADYLMSRNSWVDPRLLVKTKSVNFTTRDNQVIYGYLTLPKTASDTKLPLVVYPHGGPHGVKDQWGYQWVVQLLANRGYAVLQVNFRGSAGFGRDFEQIGYGKWGTLMQDDITDATLALIERNIVDSKRICIYGGSYGGYAALMGVVREPDLYQCAIGSAGVYDLPLMFKEGDIVERSKSGLAYLKEAIGDDLQDIKKRSPVYNAKKIKASVLLIHGSKDQRVPISQAFALMEAFDKLGKKYQWMRLANEGHGYNDENNRKQIFGKILSFLNENIGTK